MGAQVARGFLSQLELGYCEPSLTTLRALATELGVAPSAILALAESLAPPLFFARETEHLTVEIPRRGEVQHG